jgi:hypothetical protein
VTDEKEPKKERDSHPSSLKVSLCRQCPEEDKGCCDDGHSEDHPEYPSDRVLQVRSSGFRGRFGGGGIVGGGAVDLVSYCFELGGDGVVWTTYQLVGFWFRRLFRRLQCLLGASAGNGGVGWRFVGRCGLVEELWNCFADRVWDRYSSTMGLLSLLFCMPAIQ